MSLPAANVGKAREICERFGVPFERIGTVGGDTLIVDDVLEVPVEELAERHQRALDPIVS